MNILRYRKARSHEREELLSTKNRKAFTLVELVVTVVILGILATIAFINFSSYPRQARDAVRITNVEGIEKAIEFYKIKDGDYPLPSNYGTGQIAGLEGEWYIGEFGDDVANKIDELQEKPQDPNTKQSYYYALSTNRKNYRIIAKLEATGKEYVVANKVRCKDNYTNVNGKCLAVTQDFTDTTGTGTHTWNGTSWETNYTSCTAPYIQDGTKCIPDPNTPLTIASNGVAFCGGETPGTTVQKDGETWYIAQNSVTNAQNHIDHPDFGTGGSRVSANRICTSHMTNMSRMFSGKNTFNEDLSSFDTSNVTNMSYMFSGAVSFNQPVSI